MILRGGAEQFIEETERSLHDAIMIVRRAIKNDSVVAGTAKQQTTLHPAYNEFQTAPCYNEQISLHQNLYVEKFAYHSSEHPLTTISFFCIFLLVVSRT